MIPGVRHRALEVYYYYLVVVGGAHFVFVGGSYVTAEANQRIFHKSSDSNRRMTFFNTLSTQSALELWTGRASNGPSRGQHLQRAGPGRISEY